MAKILVLNGSPHKSASTTMAVTNAFVKGMCEGGEYESVPEGFIPFGLRLIFLFFETLK